MKKKDKQIVIVIAIAALAIVLFGGQLFGATIVTGSNIISNGDFESGTNGWAVSLYDPNGVGYTGTFTVVLGTGLSAHYGHFVGVYPSESPQTGFVDLEQNVVGYNIGTSYSVIFDYQSDIWFACTVIFQDASWAPVGSNVNTVLAPSASWSTQEFSVGQIPVGTAHVRLAFNPGVGGPAGYFNLDNVQMGITTGAATPTPTVTPTPPGSTPTPTPSTTPTPSGANPTPTPTPTGNTTWSIPASSLIIVAFAATVLLIVVWQQRGKKRR